MKVKVSYTVDHEEVPRLVDDLVASCRAELSVLADFAFDVRDLQKTQSQVADLQNRLDVVAGKLEDCLNLCRGYEGVTKPAPEVEAPPDE
tara:strand:+ start:387 stop:656 length:270 start_codon:yes stop_codon:yes gene_type:complete